MKLQLILATLALAASSLVAAQPSEYYVWKNKATGAGIVVLPNFQGLKK